MIRLIVNGFLAKRDRVDVLLLGIFLAVGIRALGKLLGALRRLPGRREEIVPGIIRILRLLPAVHAKIEKEKSAARKSIEHSILVPVGDGVSTLPEAGVDAERIVGILSSKSSAERSNWTGGNLTGAVYSTSEDIDKVQSFALSHFGKTNLLHPDIFTHTRQMEAEVIAMTLSLFSGGPESCGSVTSGGTESILLAMKTYRDFAKASRNITVPNIVVPSTAHAACIKAGEYFGIQVRRAWCDPERFFEVDLSSMETLIDSNTVALVGSAPQYPHGTMDPIPAIARLARDRGIGCHVDGCLGSFLLPFLQDELPFGFDFSVPGVTSISCDTHKYAYAPKGSSVLMWRSAAVRRFQYSVCSDWEGGLYATPTVSGSRSSSAVVGAWATMLHMGREGYRECAFRIRAAAKMIERTVREDLGSELKMLGRVDTSVVSFTSLTLSIYDIADFMKSKTKRKWTVAILQKPAGVHFAVTMANADHCAEFSEDLVSAVRSERRRVAAGGKVGASDSAAIYGSTASVPITLVNELVVDYLDTCYALAPPAAASSPLANDRK